MDVGFHGLDAESDTLHRGLDAAGSPMPSVRYTAWRPIPGCSRESDVESGILHRGLDAAGRPIPCQIHDIEAQRQQVCQMLSQRHCMEALMHQVVRC